jgi:K+-transporting ATPase KdpF subunit
MLVEHALGLVLAIAVAGYLVVALIDPDRF